MKKIKSVVLTGVLLVAAFSLIVAANAGFVTPNITVQEKNQGINPLDFTADISIQVFEGEGCECIPIIGVNITAFSKDSYHETFNITNDEGYCVLHLNYDEMYQVHIVADGFESVLFDFRVIDHQPFIFNLKKTDETSTTGIHFLERLLHRFNQLRR